MRKKEGMTLSKRGEGMREISQLVCESIFSMRGKQYKYISDITRKFDLYENKIIDYICSYKNI